MGGKTVNQPFALCGFCGLALVKPAQIQRGYCDEQCQEFGAVAGRTSGIVIVGCGTNKLATAAPAGELYTGSYFRACSLTAAAIAPGRWFILSARYGLVAPSDELEPYDLTLGAPGAVNDLYVRRQASVRGLLGEHVTALCGRRYADLVAEVWPRVDRPLARLGIGQQRHVLAELRKTA
jgi:hypothetical protein